MKIGTLIEALQSLNPDFDVVLSRDSEGNGFGKLTGLGVEHFHQGEVQEVSDERPANAVVLWP